MATSTLNPNAPIFVPLAYRAVEDFSDQWYDLVHSSPSFRDYWLHECFQDPQEEIPSDDFFDYALSDVDLDADFQFDSRGNTAVESKWKKKKKNDISLILFVEWLAGLGKLGFFSFFFFFSENGNKLDLVSLGLLKWRKQPRGSAENTKYGEKAPKIVTVRVNPRPIKQPR